MILYDNLLSDKTKPLLAEIGKCNSCEKEIYSNRLYTINAMGLFHLSCYNEIQKKSDDEDGE